MESLFKDVTKKFVVSLFIQEIDFKQFEKTFTMLGNQKNIQMLVQPCPFEAVEFLCRIDFDIKGHVNSQSKVYFWQAIEVPALIEEKLWKKISDIHHAYLVSIIQNQADNVLAYASKLKELLQ